MKALIATGRPEELVTLGETGSPRPQPGEALVRVDAFSVNRGEMYLLEERGPGRQPGRTSRESLSRLRRTGPARPPASA
jgi:NADPH:quinone reductase